MVFVKRALKFLLPSKEPEGNVLDALLSVVVLSLFNWTLDDHLSLFFLASCIGFLFYDFGYRVGGVLLEIINHRMAL